MGVLSKGQRLGYFVPAGVSDSGGARGLRWGVGMVIQLWGVAQVGGGGVI